MKIISNEKLIKRNKVIGQVTTISSLVILAIGLYLSFQNTTSYITYSFLALILGFILSQIGVYMGNRWGRRPRPDEVIDASLKGLDDRYSLYHYVTPVPHLLLGPAGIWIILPYVQGGTISFKKDRWHQKGGNAFLKFFAQEGIGRPDLEVLANTTDLQRFFEKKQPGSEIPPIQSILVFTNKNVVLNIENAPIPTITVEKLKDFIRRVTKEKPVSDEKINSVAQLLD
jgi:hypothetical protein